MSLRNLTQALQDDNALHFDDEGCLVPDQGWALQYANGFVAYVNTPLETTLTIGRNDTPINADDEKDLRIIGRQAGYFVQINDVSITFESVY